MNSHSNELFASFWEHVEELRTNSLRIFCILIISTALSFTYSDSLISFLKRPLSETNVSNTQEIPLQFLRINNETSTNKSLNLPEKSLVSLALSNNIISIENQKYEIKPGGHLVYLIAQQTSQDLVILTPLEGILISLKISLWSGLILSSPLWIYSIINFLLPGLKKEEKKLILPFLLLSFTFILIGILFAYFFTIPISNHYLYLVNSSIGINLWSLKSYLDYTLFLLIANGIAFESGAVGIFAIHLRLISARQLIACRRPAIVAAFILAALLTPPDILTQFLLAIPLIGIYEALIVYGKVLEKTKHSTSLETVTM